MMKIALCQLNSRQDKEANIVAALKELDKAGQNGAEVAVLPECVDYMGEASGIRARAEPHMGPTVERFSDKARQYGMWILAGTIRTTNDGDERCSNTAYLINPAGEVTYYYNKVHMFDVRIESQVDFLESSAVKPGAEVGFTHINNTPVGISICYDIRFPELFRIQALKGARILFVPAAFTLFTGKDHWEVLLRARAIENQCFVVAVGQGGTHAPGIATYGRSMVIDPWGTVIACAPDGVNTTLVTIDDLRIDEVRQNVPSLVNRQPDVYKLGF